MKKFFILLFIVVTIFIFSGCGEIKFTEGEEDYYIRDYKYGKYVYTYIDPETGVNYFIRSNGGITLRVNADGTPYVTE